MSSFTKLFILAAVLSAPALSAGARVAIGHAHCDNAKVTHDHAIDVSGRVVHFTGYSCDAAGLNPRGAAPSPRKVCGSPCTTSCNSVAGILPPISQDCATIESAIKLFENTTSPTFVVDASHVETLTFGTCNYFFTNTGTDQLEYCWADLSSNAHAAGAACFPPHQPFSPEGVCTPYYDTWVVGAAHS